jgi:hypothetical protein
MRGHWFSPLGEQNLNGDSTETNSILRRNPLGMAGSGGILSNSAQNEVTKTYPALVEGIRHDCLTRSPPLSCPSPGSQIEHPLTEGKLLFVAEEAAK